MTKTLFLGNFGARPGVWEAILAKTTQILDHSVLYDVNDTQRLIPALADAEIVVGAWDFGRINRCYERHLKILGERPEGALRTEAAARMLQNWAASEREAWLDAVTNDPLLPARILPSDYLGQQAWQQRVEVLQQAGRQLRTYNSRSF